LDILFKIISLNLSIDIETHEQERYRLTEFCFVDGCFDEVGGLFLIENLKFDFSSFFDILE